MNGIEVTGTNIGGPTFFFNFNLDAFSGTAFRADITDVGLVASGANILVVDGLLYPAPAFTVGNGNHGAGLLVVVDDGGATSDLGLKDGIDWAFCGFEERRQPMVVVPVTIPAGATSLTVRSGSGMANGGCPQDPLSASLTWVAAALSVPAPVCSLGDFVFLDENQDGIQDPFDLGIPDVKLNLTRDCENRDGTSIDPNFMEMVRTDADGIYEFTDLLCGCKYIVQPDDCNFVSGPPDACPDGGTPGNLVGLMETPPNQGDGCNDSEGGMAMPGTVPG